MTKIAALVSTWFDPAHAHVILGRWLKLFEKDAAAGFPPIQTKLAAVWQEQECGERNFGPQLLAQGGVPLYTDPEQALNLGGDSFAADGVLIIAEHGIYPLNRFGQKMYPRWEYTSRVLDAIESSGRIVPIFIDKGLSYDPHCAIAMYDRIQSLGVPTLAGSSLTHCPLNPTWPWERERPLREVVVNFCGGQEIYGFHSMDLIEPIIDGRKGASHGIRSVRSFRGHAVLRAMNSGVFSRELLELALGRAIGDINNWEDSVSWEPVYEKSYNQREYSNGLPPEPVAFIIEYSDGLQVSHVYLGDIHRKFAVAAHDHNGEVATAVPDVGGIEVGYTHFARLSMMIDEMMLSKTSPVPLIRPLTATVTLAAAMRAIQLNGKPYAPNTLAVLNRRIAG